MEDGKKGMGKERLIDNANVLGNVLTKTLKESAVVTSTKLAMLRGMTTAYEEKLEEEELTKGVAASATVIVVSRDNLILIGKRAKYSKYPGLWTVPGGKLKRTDGEKPNADGTIYRIAEKGAMRELTEETGMKASQLVSLTMLVSMMLKDDRFIFSFWGRARDMSSEIKLSPSNDLIELRWINSSQICDYKFVPGLDEELIAVFQGIGDTKKIYAGGT